MRWKTIFLTLVLFLAGCSTGGNRSGGTAAPAPGPESASLQLRVDVGQLTARARGRLTRLVIRVVDAQEIARDVIDPVAVALGNESIITRTVTNIPLGLRRVILEVYDDENVLVGGARSDPIDIGSGTNTPLTLQVQLFGTLRFSVQPSGTLINQPIAPALQVELLGSSASGDSVTLSLSNNPGGSTLSGTTTVQAVNGVATFQDISLDRPGSGYVLTAAASGFSPVASEPFDVAVAVGPPSQLAFVVQPAASMVGQVLAPPVQVAVQDAAGITVPTALDPVSLALGSNPGATALLGTLSVVPVNGVATFSDLHLDVPGNGYTLVASAAGLPDASSNPFLVTNTPAQLGFGTQPSDGQARALLAPFTVEVQDQFGNVVPGATDVVTVVLDQPPPTVSGTSSVAAVNGVATFNNLKVSKSGSAYTLTASAPGLTSSTSDPFDQSFPRGYLTPLAALPGGLTGPLRGAISTDGAFLYVGQFSTPGRVLGFAIDVAGGLTALGGSPYDPLGDNVGGVAVTPDNTEVVVSNASNGTLAKFVRALNGDLMAPPGVVATVPQPLGVVVRPGTPQYAYTMSNFSQAVDGFDLSTGLQIPGGSVSTTGITQTAVLHPNGNFLFVSSGDVFAINGTNGDLTAVPGSPFASASGGRSQAINPAGTFLYTTGVNQLSVNSINPATGALTPISGSPFAVAGDLTSGKIVLNGEFLYCYANGSPNILIFALDPTTGVPTQIEDSPVVGTRVPFELITDPLDRFVYGAEFATGQLFGYSIVP